MLEPLLPAPPGEDQAGRVCSFLAVGVCSSGGRGRGGPPYRLPALQSSPGALQLRDCAHTSARTSQRLLELQKDVQEKCPLPKCCGANVFCSFVM